MLNKEFPQSSELILKAAISGLAEWTNEQISLDDYLDRVSSQLRPPVSSILFEYFRHKALIDQIISSKCVRLPQPRYYRLLAMTLTQCFFQDGIRAESAVNVAVDFARRKYGKSASGFINGVLRAIFREDLEAYQKAISDNPLLAFPKNLQKRWKQHFGEEELTIMAEALNEEAPLTFRLTGEVSEDELVLLKAEKLPKFDWAADMQFFSVGDCKKLFRGDFLSSGRIYIQDPVTTLAPSMVDIKGGERILDMCAAPGGKSLILAERLQGSGELIAADHSERRQALTRENFESRNLDCRIIVGAADELKFSPASFDIILVDVPCTNTGVFRHKADALWRFNKSSLSESVKLQKNILEKAAELIKVEGQIVYSTCSIEEEENQRQIEDFLSKHSDFELISQKLLLPCKHHDGAFVAIITKR